MGEPSDFQSDIDAVGRIAAVPTILDVVCRTTGMGFCAIARVTEDRWITCVARDGLGIGLAPGDELKIETTICQSVRELKEVVVIDHVAEDETYRGHPTPALYGFQSYISMPIVLPDGTVFGTLCAIDPQPRRLKTPETIGTFKLFTELIAFHLDADARVARSESILLTERSASVLREQFIAVLGHELRNPLAAIDAGARMLQRTPREGKDASVIGLMRTSVARMAGLIDNVMDFARGRLGGGLSLSREARHPLEPVLAQVVAELRSVWPDRVIDLHIAIAEPVLCDHARIAQLFSNLLANALTYGAVNRPVRVRASTASAVFTLAIANANAAEPIPAAVLAKLFQPFARGTANGNSQGLGLGLYIAAEVARAHGGRLDVTSKDDETCFTLTMPTA